MRPDVPRVVRGPWSIAPGAIADEHTIDALAARVAATPKGLVVAGWGTEATAEAVGDFVEASGWPLLADPLSGVRTDSSAISTYDTLLRIPDPTGARMPELVVRLGAMPTSKPLCHPARSHRSR